MPCIDRAAMDRKSCCRFRGTPAVIQRVHLVCPLSAVTYCCTYCIIDFIFPSRPFSLITEVRKYLQRRLKGERRPDGQAFKLVGGPASYGLAPFFELHVWAWRANPYAAFCRSEHAMSCESHSLEL